jgi:hypothetical protein
VLIRDDGAPLALFASDMVMRVMQRMNPELVLEPLVAEAS